MKIILFALFAFAVALAGGPPVGENFPAMRTENLDHKSVSIPNDSKGKPAILVLAYSQQAEKDLLTWMEPAYDRFIAKTELMADIQYDINLYFIPMFTGSRQGLAAGVQKQMKKDVQDDIQPHILIYKGEIEPYKSGLKMEDGGKPYIFVLDSSGKIVYVTSGAYTEAKMDEIDDKLD
ncbi:MAG TPA: hypothetical protein VI731_06345 [Bacteroidia bacterium]|nr:hypothetical protein [Bacteroidia bacterium]